jgi:hypothetical protein
MPQAHTSHLESGSAWSVYEANVQAYRGLSLSTQSLFLTAGAVLLADGLAVPFLAIMTMSIIATWYVWFPVIFARTAIVDYYKFHLASLFDSAGNAVGPGTPEDDRLREKDYARTTNRALRRRVHASLQDEGAGDTQRFRTLRATRRKIDVVIPALLTVVWFIFVGQLIFG